MNRLEIRQVPLATHQTPQSSAYHKLNPALTPIEHTLFIPLRYERNYAYPLLIWLHGADHDERQLKRVMPHLSLQNYIGVAPRGTSSLRRGDSPQGFDWHQTAEDSQTAEAHVETCIELVRSKYRIAEHRIFIGGSDRGGTMALRVGLQRPEWFAGIISLGGAFPVGQQPLYRFSQLHQIPIFYGYNRDDQGQIPAEARGTCRLVHATSTQFTWKEYGAEERALLAMLRDTNLWIMEQIARSNALTRRSQID